MTIKEIIKQPEGRRLEFKEIKLIENTIPENKNHPKQKLRVTKRGIVFLVLLKK